MCTFYYPYQWRAQRRKRNIMWQCIPSVTLSSVFCLIYSSNPEKTPESSLENCLNNRTHLLCFLHVSTQKGKLSEKLLCLHCSKRLRVPLCSPTFFLRLGGKTHVGAIRLPHWESSTLRSPAPTASPFTRRFFST